MCADHQAPTDPIHIARVARQARVELPTVGPFRAVSILGEAGMGIVYLAEQTSPLRRQVALKLIRAGYDSREMVARFERERQALARMSHPHIAQVYDAGSCPDGRPYFAMEYVPGVPITQFCDRNKLGIRRRLELFSVVCDAIEHAHQKGLIHRDIKPSNVLVSGTSDDACPKVIDFGIAKGVGDGIFDDTFSTLTGQFVGTPAYMSPEQASMGEVEIDHRTDVYSLGVLLYELLVGVLPFQLGGRGRPSLAEVQKIIREQDPIAPSTRLARMGAAAETIATQRGTDTQHLRRELRREIDWLLMKALEKQPQRRYATAQALADDVRRYLRHEPLSVGPPTWGYRSRKFVRRRRKSIAATGIISVVALAVAVGWSGFHRAAVARERAVDESVARVFAEANGVAYRNPEEATERLQKLVQDYPDHYEASLLLVNLLERQNRVDEAIQLANSLLQKGLSPGPVHLLLARLHRAMHPDVADQHRELARTYGTTDPLHEAMLLPEDQAESAVTLLTNVLKDGQNYDASRQRAWRRFHLRDYAGMLADADVLIATNSGSPTAWNTRGVALSWMLRLPESITAFTTAIGLAQGYAPTYLNRANSYRAANELTLAWQDCDRAIMREPEFGGAYALRSAVHFEAQRPKLARSDAERALALDSTNGLATLTLARLEQQAGNYHAAMAHFNAAVMRSPRDEVIRLLRGDFNRMLRMHDAAIADYSFYIDVQPQVPQAYYGRAAARFQAWDLDGSMSDYDKAISLEPDAAQHYHGRARVLRWTAQYEEALRDHDKAVDLSGDAASPLAGRAMTLICMGNHRAAIDDLRCVTDQAPPDAAMHWLWIYEQSMLLREFEEAESALEMAGWVVREPKDAYVVVMIAGQIGREELVSIAEGSERCGAMYYAGVKASLLGLQDEAVAWFEQCVAENCSHTAEFDLAHCRSAF